MQVTDNKLLLLEKPRKKIIHEFFIRTSKYERYFGREVMKSLATYFSLPFEAGKVVVIEFNVIFFGSEYQ
jgi:hypothetical protein